MSTAVSNPNARLETFCDGVFAIALTLLIIDIKFPAGENFASTNDLWLALQHLLPRLFAFLLSFVIIFITWVNHHNALKLVNKSSSACVTRGNVRNADGVVMKDRPPVDFVVSVVGLQHLVSQ